MRIVVAGVGAMGSVYGGLLAVAGHEVGFLDSGSEHLAEIRSSGLAIERDGRETVVRPTVLAEPSTPADLALIFPKSYATRQAAERAAPHLDADGTVLTLQNGLGNAEVLANVFAPEQLLVGVSYHGATLVRPGVVRHTAAGRTTVGPVEGSDMGKAAAVAEVFSDAGLPTRATADVESDIWGKLLVNVGVNPVAALTGMTCAQLVSSCHTWEVVRKLIEEATTVAGCEEISLPYDDPVEQARTTMEAAGHGRVSMLQDLQNNRRTEVEALNGAICRLAAKHGVDASTNGVVAALIRAKESQSN